MFSRKGFRRCVFVGVGDRADAEGKSMSGRAQAASPTVTLRSNISGHEHPLGENDYFIQVCSASNKIRA